MRYFFPLALVILFLGSCESKLTEEEISQIGITQCHKVPEYVQSKGFNPERTAYSTSDGKINGVVLIELPRSRQDTLIKKFVDPSWTRFGNMGSVTTDDLGNAYTAPMPHVNNLSSPLSQINRIYKIDHITGQLAPFKELPATDTTTGVVQYAIMGLYFDCQGRKLYVATVAGSTRDNENGIIYEIDPETGKILDQLKGHDAMGLFVGGVTGKKLLYFGSARNPEINSIELTKSGDFKGKVKMEVSLDQLGPRGDDKARRIRYDQLGNLIVYGIEFNFNLTAPSIKAENLYHFRYLQADEKWEYVK